MWTKFAFIMNHVYVAGISLVLGGAFWVQFYYGEFPCPLCLLQRMCMILAAIGPAFIMIHGNRSKSIGRAGLSLIGTGFGMAILAAVAGLAISSRQVLLHIAPGDPGYGSAVFGLHLYTWALIVFVVIIIVSGLTILFRQDVVAPQSESSHWMTRAVIAVFGAMILLNVLSSIATSGWHWYLPDNPTEYLLFHDWPFGDGR